ncbi:endoglucanase IV [Paraphoma chrysanthemicola]|uniref:Endoglucanase IV n=1 Tax=Paraphoma chrysanthemicola TaxID=798071 RepID=A0A8K0R347_9PLEO|nr:endoglucanase IV [Paraphoma chrysanthemicola]
MWFTLAILFCATPPFVTAHGRITHITTSSGTVYAGWDPESALESRALPPLAAWKASNFGNDYVPPTRFNTSDIICHFNATPGALHVNTFAGDKLQLEWNQWPVSHVGPVMTYLAACNGSCSQVKKESLEWVKIDELGWLNSTGWDDLMLGGTWASDVLIANSFTWTVQIPKDLEAGDYVLRHELIALHVAESLGGAQAYPQCVNVRVAKEKSGTKKLEGGVPGTRLYGERDKGILVDVHRHIEGYEIPGPRVWSGAVGLRQPNEIR